MDHDHELEEKYEGLIPDAMIFAFNAHSGQYRKVNPEQYIIHPLRVSEFLLKNFSTHPNLELMRIAAILHDTIEDTWVTEKDIEMQFGKKAATLVTELTKPKAENKAERLSNYIKILKESSDESKIIKLADIFDNVVLSTDNVSIWKDFLEASKKTLDAMMLKKKNPVYDKIKSELMEILDKKLKNQKNE